MTTGVDGAVAGQHDDLPGDPGERPAMRHVGSVGDAAPAGAGQVGLVGLVAAGGVGVGTGSPLDAGPGDSDDEGREEAIET